MRHYSSLIIMDYNARTGLLLCVWTTNIMAQGLSTPDPSLSPAHLSIRRGRATSTHYTHRHVSLMVSRNTTLVHSVGLRIGPACDGRPQRWHVKGAGVAPQSINTKIKVLFERLCALSYSPSIVTMALSCILFTRYSELMGWKSRNIL